MRTDSIRISEMAQEMAKEYILENFGKEYLGKKKETKTKQKIQDAHEGIRPTDINLTPDFLVKYLDTDQLKLYRLIWQRFLVSQLAPMKYEQFELIANRDKFDFRGTINKIVFDGYYKVFKDEEDLPVGDFPEIKIGDKVKLEKLDIKEDYTKAPSRFTESSLVKKLESEGIGRPSTYASIIETLNKREYVKIEGKSFIPSALGYEIKEVLEENFPNIMDVKFTAELENELDDVADGEKDWVSLLKIFYTDLESYIEKFKIKVEEEANRIIESDMPCPCGKGNMILKTGRFGRYLACPNSDTDSDCKEKISLKGIEIDPEEIKNGKIYVKDRVEKLLKEKKGKETDVKTEDGAKYLLKVGRYGAYLESENYSQDKLRMPLPSEIRKKLKNNEVLEKDGVVLLNHMLQEIKDEEDRILKEAGVCEKCGKPFKIGRGRWGKFLACTGYPECKNIRKIAKNKEEK